MSSFTFFYSRVILPSVSSPWAIPLKGVFNTSSTFSFPFLSLHLVIWFFRNPSLLSLPLGRVSSSLPFCLNISSPRGPFSAGADRISPFSYALNIATTAFTLPTTLPREGSLDPFSLEAFMFEGGFPTPPPPFLLLLL